MTLGKEDFLGALQVECPRSLRIFPPFPALNRSPHTTLVETDNFIRLSAK